MSELNQARGADRGKVLYVAVGGNYAEVVECGSEARGIAEEV
jgi:hypothetical protein